MKITNLDKKDISQIRPLWERLNNLHEKLSTHFKRHFTSFTFEERFKQIENKDSSSVFVAKENSNILGYCIVSVQNKIGEIDSIYIDPQYRNKKVGENLMAAAESWLQSKDITTIQVSVAEGNESVFGFYNKKGYQQRYTMLEKKA